MTHYADARRARYARLPGEIGARVRAQRLRLGLSQEAVARAAGVSVDTLQNLEAGQTDCRATILAAVCDAVGLTPAEAHGAQAADALADVVAMLPPDVRAEVAHYAQWRREVWLLGSPAGRAQARLDATHRPSGWRGADGRRPGHSGS